MKILLHKDFMSKYSEKDRDTIRAAINFYIDRYHMRKYNARVEVSALQHNLSPHSFLAGHAGDMGNRVYVIRAYAYSTLDDLISVLFHELTHVHQMLRGDLNTDLSVNKWKNVPYPKLGAYDASADFQSWYDMYMRLPWEIEARQIEKIAFAEFINRPEAKINFWSKLKFWR